MTDGMKSGAGSDPFADDTNDDDASKAEQETLNQDTDESAGTESNSQAETGTPAATGSQDNDTEQSEDRLPYIFARNTVKSDRKMTQYFLRDEAQAVEKDAQRAIEEKIGTDVSLIDVREALVLVGAEHLDEVADELREWGYRFKED
jgi:hypothetical protein